MSESSPFKRYLRTVGVCSFGLVAVVMLFNFFVDPYNRFGMNRLGIYISAEREAKQKMIARYDPDVVMMGDSRTAFTDTSAVKSKRVFNLGLGAGTVYEGYRLAEAYVHDVDLVILGIGLGTRAHDSGNIPDPTHTQSFEDIMSFLAGLQTTEYSIRTLRRKLTGEVPVFDESGSLYMKERVKDIEADDPAKAAYDIQRTFDFAPLYEDYPDSFDMIIKLRDLMEERGIALQVFIYPVHPKLRALLDGTEREQRLMAWKEQLFELFPDAIDLSYSPAFSTMEHFFEADSIHFRPETGTRIIEEVLLPRHYGDSPGH